jgi:hypothetical protein
MVGDNSLPCRYTPTCTRSGDYFDFRLHLTKSRESWPNRARLSSIPLRGILDHASMALWGRCKKALRSTWSSKPRRPLPYTPLGLNPGESCCKAYRALLLSCLAPLPGHLTDVYSEPSHWSRPNRRHCLSEVILAAHRRDFFELSEPCHHLCPPVSYTELCPTMLQPRLAPPSELCYSILASNLDRPECQSLLQAFPASAEVNLRHLN